MNKKCIYSGNTVAGWPPNFGQPRPHLPGPLGRPQDHVCTPCGQALGQPSKGQGNYIHSVEAERGEFLSVTLRVRIRTNGNEWTKAAPEKEAQSTHLGLGTLQNTIASYRYRLCFPVSVCPEMGYLYTGCEKMADLVTWMSIVSACHTGSEPRVATTTYHAYTTIYHNQGTTEHAE